MGKYNFNAQRWADIEQRLSQLEAANNELRRENAQLRQQKHEVPDRILSRDMNNYGKAVEIFGINIKDGKIVTDETETRGNFATFYQALFRWVAPRVYTSEGKPSRIVYEKMANLTESQYRVYVELMESVIDLLDYAKKKMKGDADHGNGTDLTVG